MTDPAPTPDQERDPKPWFCRHCGDRLATNRSPHHILSFKPRLQYSQNREDYPS